MWRLIKKLNFGALNPLHKQETFRIKTHKMESMLIKAAKYVTRRRDPYGLEEEAKDIEAAEAREKAQKNKEL